MITDYDYWIERMYHPENFEHRNDEDTDQETE